MPTSERVLVAMSGGVDSAVAAARLQDEGYDVVGVTLHLWDYPDERAAGGADGASPGANHGRCCAPEDQYDARRTADALGFPHYTFDRRVLFADTVVAPFVDAYLAGETPSPCAACNRGVKLRELFGLADRLGARHVATGHYARVLRGERGALFLGRGRDPAKDQSYFLYATPEAQLARLLFPVGESTKAEVRAEAVARGLPGATKGESQELCFVGAKAHAYATFVEARGRDRVRPGAIVDAEGRERRDARRDSPLHDRTAKGARCRAREAGIRDADRRRVGPCPPRRRRVAPLARRDGGRHGPRARGRASS